MQTIARILRFEKSEGAHTEPYLKCIMLVSGRSSLSDTNMGVRIELTLNISL